MALDLVDPPAVEPVSLDEAKFHARCTSPRLDDVFADLWIPAARGRAELATQRQMIRATYVLSLPDWPCEGWIDVPRAPLFEVVSIQYVDAAGDLQTLATSAYDVDAPQGPLAARGRIAPAYGESWPTVRSQMNAVLIRFTCGYGENPEDVPAQLRLAMCRDIATMYAHPEDIVTGTTATQLPRSSASVYRSFRSRALQRRVA